MGAWQVARPGVYVGAALLLVLGVRVVLSALKAVESRIENNASGFWRLFGSAFNGGEPDKDYWQPFVLGLLESMVFPILIATNHWTYIGAWLGLKTIAQAGAWKKRRVFNRFLIGTALVLMGSYLLAHMVDVTTTANKQLHRTVMDKLPSHTGQRAAAELRR